MAASAIEVPMNRITAMCATHSIRKIEKMKVSNLDDSKEYSS